MTKKHPDILDTAFPNEIFGKDVDTKEFEGEPLTRKQWLGTIIILAICFTLALFGN